MPVRTSVVSDSRGDAGRGLRVLVVEDEFLIRWSVAETLAGAGHTVIEADSAASARSVLSAPNGRFDVVLLDYRLPDSNDLSLFSDVRRRWPHVPVILMSAHATPDVASAAVELGAYEIVHKPFEMETLRRLVEHACGLSGA